VSGQFKAPVGKETLYPLNRTLGGFQRQSGHFGEEKDVLFLLTLPVNLM
jgi:hypothetical protein